jgi:hypothetical protein
VTDHDSWIVLVLSNGQGYKAEDLNGNGARDQGEPGLGDWFIVLSGVTIDGQSVLQTTQTDSSGHYEFTNLMAGEYTVSEIMQAGWRNTSARSVSFVLGFGSTFSVDFLNVPYINITGYKFDDEDMDGVWDNDEVGVPGWNITLTGTNANGPVNEMTTTDATGYYEFLKLLPGSYFVTEESRNGWFPTSATTIPLEADEPIDAVINFSNARYGSISGFKFLDLT